MGIQAAEALLEESVTPASGGDATDWFFLAMAARGLVESDQAKSWFLNPAAWTWDHDPHSRRLGRCWSEAAEVLDEPPPNGTSGGP